jgi:hypothetical protein
MRKQCDEEFKKDTEILEKKKKKERKPEMLEMKNSIKKTENITNS